MKIRKEAVIVIIIAILFIIGIGMYSRYQIDKSREAFAVRIMSDDSTVSSATVEQLKAAIAANEKKMEQHVQDAAKTAYYWKILSVRLQDRGLYGDALEALKHAIYYAPSDPVLQYYTGLSAGILAKSTHSNPGATDESTGRAQYFALAEEAYLRAIELDPKYTRPMYGLAVLYVFELNRPEEAIPYLKRCLEITRNDVDSMAVMARAYFMMKDYKSALDLYNLIISVTTDPQKRIDAQNNRQIVMGFTRG